MGNTQTTTETGTKAAGRERRVQESEIAKKEPLGGGRSRVTLKSGEKVVIDTDGRIIQGA